MKKPKTMKTSLPHPSLGSLLATVWALSGASGFGGDAAYPAAVGGDAPLAYYRFQDSPVRNHLNANSGSLGAPGNATNINTRAWAGALRGDGNPAQFFDATAWTVIPWNATLNPENTQPFTVEAWFYPASDQINGGQCALNNRTVYSGLDRQGWVVFQRAPDFSYEGKAGYEGVGWNFRMYRGSGSSAGLDVVSAVPYQVGKWTHVAVVYDPGQLTDASVAMYIDGQLATNVTYAGEGVGYVANSGSLDPAVAVNGPAGLALGAYNNTQPGSNPYFGAIDEFAFYSGKLSSNQILAHYQSGTNASRTTSYDALVQADKPVAYLRLDEAGAGKEVAINLGDLRATGHATNSASARHSTRDALAGRTDGGSFAGHLRNGGGSFADVPFAPENNPDASVPFTLEGWFRPFNDAQSPGPSPVNNRMAGSIPNRTGWVIYQRDPNESYKGPPAVGGESGVGWTFRMYTGNGSSAQDVLTGVPYTMGEWQHLVFTWEPQTDTGPAANGNPAWTGILTAYVDGLAVASNTAAIYSANAAETEDGRTPTDLAIGSYNLASGGGEPFEGDIDEVALYTKYVLTPAQILSHYQAGTNAHPATNYETLVLTAAYDGAPTTAQRTGPATYFRFSEPAYSPAANSGSLHSLAAGSLVMAANTAAGPGTAGFESANTAVTLDGTNGWVALDNPAGLDVAGPITLEAWIKPDATQGALARIISHGPPTPTAYDTNTYPLVLSGSLLSSNEVFLRLEGEGPSYAVGSSDGSSTHGVSAPVPTGDLGGGQWIYLVGTYDGANWRLFRNGVQLASAADKVGALPVGYGDWAIGATGNGWADNFAGAIDEVAIYNKALAPAAISAHYARAQSSAVRLDIARSASGITLSWPSGTLQQAPTINGAWTDVPGAAAPSFTTPVGTQTFYRVKL